MERFTEMGVRKLKAPPKPQRIDKISTITRGRALALRVSYSGSKAWRVLYYTGGRPQRSPWASIRRWTFGKPMSLPASSTPRRLASRPPLVPSSRSPRTTC